MGEFFANGRAIDLILVMVALEAVLLVGLAWRAGGLAAGRAWLPNLAAGAALLLAVRAALTGAAFPIIALFLMLGCAAHAVDVALRWPGRTTSP